MDHLSEMARRQLNLTLTREHLDAFQLYARELLDWNQRANLTAITDPDAVEMRHFADSLSCLLLIKDRPPGLKLIDVGTGAGFPGLPLKIIYPDISLTLVEATGKKIDFLAHMVARLGLADVTLVNERAETIGQMAAHREQYDWVLARAVAAMPVLSEYLLPLCRVGGRCLAQKGESAPSEVSTAQETIKLLGGRVVHLTPVELRLVAETHYLVEIEKIATTPPKYPRRPGMPSKRPLAG